MLIQYKFTTYYYYYQGKLGKHNINNAYIIINNYTTYNLLRLLFHYYHIT